MPLQPEPARAEFAHVRAQGGGVCAEAREARKETARTLKMATILSFFVSLFVDVKNEGVNGVKLRLLLGKLEVGWRLWDLHPPVL